MSTLLIDFAVGGTIYLIAMLFANRFAKNKRTSKAKYYTILIVVIGALIAFKNIYVEPKYETWRNTTTFDNEIAKTEPYATLKTTFPEDYNKIKEVLINSRSQRNSSASISKRETSLDGHYDE